MKKPVDTILAANELLTHLADADAVFKGLARLLQMSVKSHWIAVYLYDGEHREFAPVLGYDLPPRDEPLFRQIPLLPERLPHFAATMRKRQNLLLTADSAASLATPALCRRLEKLHILVVPMAVRQQVLGVVFVARTIDQAFFTPAETDLIGDTVSHAAMVVNHIRLFNESLDMSVEVAKRIDVILTLDEINKAISSSLSPAKIVATAMASIERIVRCSFVAVLAEDKGRLVVMAARSDRVEIPAELQPGEAVEPRSLAGSARRSGKSRYIPVLGAMKRLPLPDRRLAQAGIASLLATPLISKGAASWVLLLGDLRPGQFAKEDLFTIEKIAAQMTVALGNARLYEEMRTLFISTIASLANAINAKSPWTKGHSERVMRTAAIIAQEMGLDEEEVERVRLGGLLHDIGKIGVMEAVLEKPAQLSDDEFPPMRLHPRKGIEILAPIDQLKEVLPGILHHHEHYDGSGYPDGLEGEAIPLGARIIAVADAFDAIVAARPYKGEQTAASALAELKRCAGTQFDPRVVEVFSSYMERKKSEVMERRET